MERTSLPLSVADTTATAPEGFLTGGKPLPYARHIFGTRHGTHPNSNDTVRLLTERLGPIAHMRQVHGTRIVHAEGSGLYDECDALISTNAAQEYTPERGLWLAVKTADCVPVLLSAPGVVAAIHAGWRGLAGGIITKVAEEIHAAYGLAPETMHLAIGPCISQPHYEVDHSFLETFEQRFFQQEAPGAKPRLNLAEVARQQAISGHIPANQVHVLGRCTFAEPNLFNSYRRHKAGQDANYAVNISLIRLK